MATLWNLLLVVSLLVLSSPQRCSGVNHDSVNGLSEEIARLKTQLQNKEEMVKAVTEENENIKQQLQNQNETVRHLEELVAECMQLVTNHTNAEKLLSNMAQDLEKRFVDHQEKEEQLEETVVHLNNTVAAQKNDTGMDHKQEIIRLVQQFNNTKDWGSLRRGLETVLDNSSEPYSQLQRLKYTHTCPLSNAAYNNSTQLVTLLLDAGLPVDTTDADVATMLHGAALGGHLQLVKLLVDRGASVNVKNYTARTPLIYAAYKDYLEIVKLLVSAGADTTARSYTGYTAFEWARLFHNTAVANYLQQLPH